MKNKGHDHVKKTRAFSKDRTWSELMLTLIRQTLTEGRKKLIFRHCLKMIITGVVRMLYPGDIEHIRYNIRCDNNARTSNASNEMRYWEIKSMYVGVELLDQHRWTGDRDVTQWPPFLIVDDNGKVSVGEVRQDDLAFKMNASSREVLKEVWFGLFITEPDRERSSISRRRCLGKKRVLGRSRFAFGCHRSRIAQTKREKERRR